MQESGETADAGFGGEFRVPLRSAVGCGPGPRRAISAQPAFCATFAALHGPRPESAAVYPLVSADRGIPAAHRRLADLFDPALHSRGAKLSYHRVRLHRREASLRNAPGAGAKVRGGTRVF